jgi:hypothetical protein
LVLATATTNYKGSKTLSARRIGVLGAGKQTRKNAVALLKDAIGSNPAEFYLVGSPFHDASRFAADYAIMAGHPVTIITETGDTGEDFSDYTDASFLERENPTEALQTVLSRGEGSSLLFAFAETDDEEPLLKSFLKAGVEVLDFAEGLYPVTLEDDGVPDEADLATVVEEPKAGKEHVEATPENVSTVADDDAGLEPEVDPTEVVTDEAQQPAVKPARKPRAPKALKVVDSREDEPGDPNDTPLALADLGDYEEILALGKAVKVLLDYVAKAGDTGKVLNVNVG